MIVVYHLFGLVTARYHLDRDGFYLRWGLVRVQIPIGSIPEVTLGGEAEGPLRPGLGFWWPGCVVGGIEDEKLGPVELFATTGKDGVILISNDSGYLAISPQDVQAFQQSFKDAVQLGSLEEIPAVSQRPDFFSARLWADLIARTLILLGLIGFLSLLGYVAFRLPRLPEEIPFGFDVFGNPAALVPPPRLLLLPLVGGVFWLTDLLVGAWYYRREEQPAVAYSVWLVALLLGGLLWGAVLQLLASV
jgi:hypothetical protein